MAEYTDAQRTEALRLYETEGPGEASRRTGIPRSTISRWGSAAGLNGPRQNRAREASEAARATWEQRRPELAVKLGEVADHLLDRVRDASGRDAPRLMTAVGIAIDKAQLLTGEPTSRNEEVGITRVERVAGQLDELAARRARRAA